MRFVVSIVLLVFTVLMAGCNSVNNAPNAKMSVDGLEGQWEVTYMLGVNFPAKYKFPVSEAIAVKPSQTEGQFYYKEQKAPYFTIQGSRFFGFDGCNGFPNGQIKFVQEKIEFDKGNPTSMACIGVDKYNRWIDQTFYEAINRNIKWEKLENGSYGMVRDGSPEYRTWRIARDGQLEILKDRVVTLRAKRKAAE